MQTLKTMLAAGALAAMTLAPMAYAQEAVNADAFV